MGRLDRWSRYLGGIMALWFGTLVLGPGLVHQCPAHPIAERASADRHGHPGHHSPEHGRHHDGCTCPALCCAAPVGWTGPAPAMPPAKAGLSPVVSAAIATWIAPLSPEHLRPFATAPPSLAAPST